MKLWAKIKRLFRKSKPTLCWIDHFSGLKAICWVRIAEDMAVKAVFPAESLRHLVAGDAFYYDLETKQFSDAGDERIKLGGNELVDQMEVARKVMAEDREALKKLAAGEAVKQDANGEWDIKEISNG